MTQVSIGISEFRANMSTILQQVEAGNIVRLLVRGKEVAKIVPPDYAQRVAEMELEALRETAVIGDVVSPIDVKWEAAE